jgi:hypothetical protein
MSKSNITNYAFLDDETKVKIYVNLPGVGNCQDENIALDHTDSSLCLTVKNYIPPSLSSSDEADKNDEDVDEMMSDDDPNIEVENETKEGNQGGDRCLSFARLYGEIEKATYRKKADKLIVTLTKKEMKEWSSVIA